MMLFTRGGLFIFMIRFGTYINYYICQNSGSVNQKYLENSYDPLYHL
jgi:hypothetical protein